MAKKKSGKKGSKSSNGPSGDAVNGSGDAANGSGSPGAAPKDNAVEAGAPPEESPAGPAVADATENATRDAAVGETGAAANDETSAAASSNDPASSAEAEAAGTDAGTTAEQEPLKAAAKPARDRGTPEPLAELNLEPKEALKEARSDAAEGRSRALSLARTHTGPHDESHGEAPGEAASESIEALKTQLEQVEIERDEVQEEYDSLLEKVGTIKQRLGERFKELEAEAEQAREEADDAVRDRDQALRELAALRERAAHDADELEAIKKQQVSQKIMFDQELANETMAKQSLELELEQLRTRTGSDKTLLEQTAKQSEQQTAELDRLRSELRAVQSQRESTESKLRADNEQLESDRTSLRKQLTEVQSQLAAVVQSSASSNERQQQLETEAKENQLLIGKLRHEAVILNDHLTHALRIVRKDSEGSTVDKELVSNLFIQFATCPRQDTKKFEILLLIANFLGWDDQRRQAVGLAMEEPPLQPQPQMVGVVGKLAEFLENRRSNK